jgi:hypothetical protein
VASIVHPLDIYPDIHATASRRSIAWTARIDSPGRKRREPEGTGDPSTAKPESRVSIA